MAENMNPQIKALVDSGKKIRSRTDKMLASLILSKFEGTLDVHFPDKTTGSAVFFKENISTDISPQKLADHIESSEFIIGSSIPDINESGNKTFDELEFLYRVIENIERKKMIKLASVFIAEYLTIKPEAVQLKFIYKELQAFTGRDKVQILPYFQKHHRIIYFLLLSRYAAIIPSSPEEKEIIMERAQRILMEGEDYKADLKTRKVKEEKSKEEMLTDFLNVHEKYRDVFHLFELGQDLDEKDLQKSYVKIVQKIHPDRLLDISGPVKDRAVNLFRSVSEAYEMLKDPVERAEVIKLMNKYQPIRSRTDYARLKEYDDAVFKGTALERLGQYNAAKIIYDEIFKQTKAPDALERKILVQWRMKPKWGSEEKNTNYIEIKEDIDKLKMMRDPHIEVLYILIEIHEHFGQIPDCMKVLNMILRFYPEDHRATAVKNRINYYDELRKKKNK